MATKSKKEKPIRTARTTIAEVNKEMQQPRLTESVRNGGRKQIPTVAEELAAHPKVRKLTASIA